MTETIVVAALFLVVAAVEWKYQWPFIRLLMVVLALLVLVFTDPSPRRAARRAIVAPSMERVTELRGSRLSDYGSGVVTMERAMVEDAKMFKNENLLALAALIWLACSPAVRRRRPSRVEASGEG